MKKVLLEISQNSQENTFARISFLTLLKKENLAQVFSCEFCKISKNTFSYRTPLVAASGYSSKRNANDKKQQQQQQQQRTKKQTKKSNNKGLRNK